jgi:hypothetical protein
VDRIGFDAEHGGAAQAGEHGIRRMQEEVPCVVVRDLDEFGEERQRTLQIAPSTRPATLQILPPGYVSGSRRTRSSAGLVRLAHGDEVISM